MKFINQFFYFKNLSHNAFLALNENREGAGERAESLNSLLKNPLSFGLADLTKLEQQLALNNNKLSNEQQVYFSQLVNFHLVRLLNEKKSNQRSRTLLDLFRRPVLNQFLSSSQRQNIELFLGQQRQELEKLANKDPQSWSENEAIALARSYRFVSHRLNTATLSIDANNQQAGEKLKLYAHTLLAKSDDDLTAKDKLFLVELARIFPDERDWANGEMANHLKAKSQAFKQVFWNQVTTPEATPDLTAQYYWDILLPDEEEALPLEVEKFLKRSSQVESLRAIGGKFDDQVNTVASHLVLSGAEYAFLNEFTEDEQNYGDKTEDLSLYQKVRKERDDSWAEYRPELERKQRLSESLKALDDEAFIAKVPDIPSHLLKEYRDNVEQWALRVPPPETPAPTAEGEEPPPPENLTETRADETKYKEWKKSVIETVFKQQSLDEETLKPLKEKYEKAQDDLNKFDAESQTQLAALSDFINPNEKAQSFKAAHLKSFKKRFASGNLVTADLDFINYLFDQDEQTQTTYLGAQPQIVKNLLNQTRNAVDDLVAGVTGKNVENIDSTKLVELDELLSYEKIIVKISADNQVQADTPLLQIYNKLENHENLKAQTVLQKVITDKRAEVLQALSSKDTLDSKAYQDFLGHYSRQHQTLNESSRVEELLSYSEEINSKRTSVEKTHEHAYSKVNDVFKEHKFLSVSRWLNTVLKPGVSAAETLNLLRAVLNEDNGFVHHKTTKLENIKTSFKNILEERLQNGFSENITEVIETALTKLDLMRAGEVAEEALKYSAEKLETSDSEGITMSERADFAEKAKIIELEARDLGSAVIADLQDLKYLSDKNQEGLNEAVFCFLQKYEKKYEPKLKALGAGLIAEGLLILGEEKKFLKDLENDINTKLNIFNQGIQQLKVKLEEDAVGAGDVGFDVLLSSFKIDVLPLFNIKESSVTLDNEKKGTLESAAETHVFIKDSLGLLKPGGAEKARAAYQKQLKEYEDTINLYKDRWQLAKKRLEHDLKWLNESAFEAKQGIPKSKAKTIIQTNKDKIEDADFLLNYFSGSNKEAENAFAGDKSEVFDNWLEAYQNPEQQGQALHFMNNFKNFADVLGKGQEDFAGESEELGAYVKDYDANKPTFLFGSKRYKLTVEFYSLKSIYMMTKQFWEFWGKKNERNQDRMASKLGQKIFGDTTFGREFNREANAKEEERVGDFKKSFEDKDQGYLVNRIKNVTDINSKDEAKAAIELIIEMGELQLDSPVFVNLLNRLQNVVHITQQDLDDYYHNTGPLRRKVADAIDIIWDRPTWTKWEKDFKDKYASKMKEYNDDLLAESQTNASIEFMELSLKNWANGEPANDFYRAKFEQYIYGSFENGFMNGYPGGDKRFFYLIKGLTTVNPKTGETLLNPESLVRLNKLEGQFHYLGALDDRNSYKLNGRIVDEGIPGAEKRPWNKKDVLAWADYFKDCGFNDSNSKKMSVATRRWLHDCLAPSGDTADRASKIDLKKVDKDDAGVLSINMQPERFVEVMQLNSGDKRPIDGDAFYVNFLSSFEANLADFKIYLEGLKNSYESEPGYPALRKKELTRFGQMIRSYFAGSQLLTGNSDIGSGQGAVVMAKGAWDSAGLDKTYDSIINTVEHLTGDKKVGEDLGGYRATLEYGISRTKDITHKEYSRKRDYINRIYNSKMFSDIERLESLIAGTPTPQPVLAESNVEAKKAA